MNAAASAVTSRRFAREGRRRPFSVRFVHGCLSLIVQFVSRLSGNSFPSSHPAQQESCLMSRVKVWAQSFSPSTIVR